MTDETGAQDAVATAAVPPPAAPVTAGSLLREAREAAGLHIAALAVAMKVPVAKLEALEADRFDLLPDAVFTRALASGVCRTLKVDASAVLDKLPQLARPKLKDNERGIDAPFRAPSDGPGPGVLDKLSWPVVAVLGLLLAAVAVYLYPRHSEPVASAPAPLFEPNSGEKPGQVTQSPDAPPAAAGTVVETPSPLQSANPAVNAANTTAAAAPAQPAPTPSQTPAPHAPAQTTAAQSPLAQAAPATTAATKPPAAQAALPAPQPVSPPASAVTPPPARLAAASAPAAQRLVAASAAAPAAQQPAKPASTPVAAASAPAQPFAGSSGAVVLRAKASSWVSVIDARGNSLLNKTLAPGEVAGISGATPLKVTVGKADGTEVLVRGQAFNLGPVSRENVARFEVK